MTVNINAINNTYRHKYHLMPTSGWMNDPNGFSYFNNEYHLFYQHYPHDSSWGPMHWAHAVSSDLISWSHKKIALKPDKEYDRNGVFSGSAIQVGNEHWLYYTGHIDSHLDTLYDKELKKNSKFITPKSNHYIRQVQCLAKSVDGITYTKYEKNPVISTEEIPRGVRCEDFRDPKVWIHNEKYYMVIGTKSIEEIGYILFYESLDGLNWNYFNQFSLGRDYGTVWECPDLFELDGKHVLLISPQEKPRVGNSYENVHSTMALIGAFDYSNGEFTVESEQELDQGFDFYAPQSILTKEGKRVMIAWMNMWDIKSPLHELKHGWNGSMTLPREISLKNGNLIQKPYHKIKAYQQNKVELANFEISGDFENSSINGTVQQIDIEFEMQSSKKFTIEFFKGADEKLSLIFDKSKNEMILSRRDSEYPIESLGNKNDFTRSKFINLSNEVILSIFLDVSSIEIFVNNGESVFTSLFFTKGLGDRVQFNSKGTAYVRKLLKWNLLEG